MVRVRVVLPGTIGYTFNNGVDTFGIALYVVL